MLSIVIASLLSAIVAGAGAWVWASRRSGSGQAGVTSRIDVMEQALANAKIATFVADLPNSKMMTSQIGAMLIGYAPDRTTVTIAEWYDTVAPEDRDRCRQALSAAL